jgi:hypothetical protein
VPGRWIIENQFGRRNLSPVQRARLALKLKPLLRKIALERKRAGVKVPDDPDQNSDQGIAKGRTLTKLAKIAGISHETIHKNGRLLTP